MNQAKTLTAAIALGLTMLGYAHADTSPKNLGAAYGEFSSANTGSEVAIPFFKFTDLDVDGYPDRVAVSFRVYTAQTNTLLYATPAKTFSTPKLPTGCSPTNGWNFDWGISLARRGNQLGWNGSAAFYQTESKRMSLGVNIELNCWDGTNNQWADMGVVYNTNLTNVDSPPNNPLSSWIYTFPGKWVEGLNGIDTDGNLVNDTIVITVSEDVVGGVNLRVMAVNPADGSISSNISYPAVR